MAPAFDEGPQFAIDKPAGLPCPHLGPDHLCTIHAQLTDKGFPGCATYDCLGAGQLVTQHLFKGKSWRDHPDLARPMIDAFRAMRDIQDMLQLVDMTETLNLSEDHAVERARLLAELAPTRWSPEFLVRAEETDLVGRCRTYLASLQSVV